MGRVVSVVVSMLFMLLAAGSLAVPVLAGESVSVLHNARIHTLASDAPGDSGLVEAMAWDGTGRILAVGAEAELRRRYPDARLIDAGGGVVVPGLIDAHAHVMGLGAALMRADLVGADSVEAVLARVQAFAETLPEGAWLLGRGWDQNRWPGKQFPTAADLDAAFPDRPVWLERVDGHAGWANSAAMRAAGVDLSGDWQTPGGRILREGGVATGVFVDAAMVHVERAVPPADAAWREQALTRALAESAELGLTGIHDMGVSLDDLALFRRFADAGRLSLRITAYADGDNAALTALCGFGPLHHGSGRLRMAGVKLYADGALGSRGAALIEDYSDEPGHRGLLVTDPQDLAAAMRKARDCGIQVATHAIGDRGNRVVLDLYREVLGEAASSNHRWRVEHAQIVALEDIARFAELGLLASMQPTHATSDMPWAEARVGAERILGGYAWRRFVEAGVRLPLGSDFPVERVAPVLGLHAAVSRQDTGGQPAGGWYPDQRLSALEALRGFTIEAAHAGFAEAEVGRLAPGWRADFVIFPDDPLTVPAQHLHALPVRSTWVDGRPVFEAR
ncbi:MAG TPA: amidohydrolase [Xanthomonadales bacterium]|nr:amidohydrolase [Xanthomonadales bacterium]